MTKHLVPILIGFLLLSITSAIAEVHCKCPRIAAQGVGDLSCSASESNSICTVDFNIFGPVREGRASELLSRAFSSRITVPDPNLDSAEAFTRSGGDAVTDFVLVYLTVGLGDGVASDQISTDFAEEALRYLSRVMDKGLREAIQEMFSAQLAASLSSQSDLSPRDFQTREVDAGSARALLSPGCLEVTVGSLWMMFKARWSAARLAPQCSPIR